MGEFFSGDYTKFDESKRINPETGLPVGQSIISEDFGTKKDAPYKTSFWKGLTGSSAGFLGAIGIVPAWKKETLLFMRGMNIRGTENSRTY